MLQPNELRELSILSPFKAWAFILFTWLLIALTFAIAIQWPYLWVYALAWILMARHQLSLAILMHDAAHKRLFKNLSWNDYVAQFFLAGPIFFSVLAYRTFHLKHHQDPLAPDDPDISLIGGYPIPAKSFARKLFRDISGQSYFKFIRYFISKSRSERGRGKRVDGKKSGPSFRMVMGSMLFTNLLLFTALWASGHPWLYLGLWLLPTATSLQFLLRIRGVAEHAGYSQNEDQRLNARTVVSPLETFFFAPNNVNYHIEHHSYPSVPWYNLPKVHALMWARGSIPKTNFFRSYRDVVSDILR